MAYQPATAQSQNGQQQQGQGQQGLPSYPGIQMQPQSQQQMGMGMNPMMQQPPSSSYNQGQPTPQMPTPMPTPQQQHMQMPMMASNGFSSNNGSAGSPPPPGMSNGQDPQQQPMQQQSLPLGLPPGLDRERLAAMSNRMAALRSQGFTEQTSPELMNLQNMLAGIQRQVARFRQMQLAQQQSLGQGGQGQGQGQMGMQQQPMMSNGAGPTQMQPNQGMQSNGPASASTPTATANGSNGTRTDLNSPGTVNGPPSEPSMMNGHVQSPGALQTAQQQQQQQQSQQHVNLTPQQMASFKAQIFALRFLQKGLPIPANVASVIFAGSQNPQQQPGSGSPGAGGLLKQEPDTAPPQSAGQQAQPALVPTPDTLMRASPTALPEQQEPQPEPEIEIEEIPDTLLAPYTAYRNPRSVLAALRTAVQNDPYKTASLPSLLPYGLDPHTLQQERNKFIQARIAQRRTELENMPSIMGDEIIDLEAMNGEEADGISKKREMLASKKLKALIELKSLNLLQKQRQLREDVVRGLNQAVSLNLVTDRNQYRASRKVTLKDARSIDQLERQQKIDRENKAKQKHLDQLLAIAKHGKAMDEAHQANKARMVRLGKNIMRWHVEAEKEEQKRIERVSKERLKALRNNDEEAYMKLIDTAKDTRITHLLRQTDSFLDSLAQAVAAQQETASERDPMAVDRMKDQEDEITDEATFGAVPVFQEEESSGGKTDYYNVAHKIKETVTHQASILTGGQLKDYQVKGLQWMISLYNNRLNGILADEMGLGKTIQTISLITYLIDVKKQPGPFLCIVPLSTLPNWQLEFAKWAPTVHVVNYKGPPLARKGIQNQMKHSSFQVCLTTYEYIIKDRPFLCRYKWIHMIIDEGHRMKNSQSKLSQTLSQHYNSRYRLILTGTPLQNNLPELWALLNFVLPKVFNSQQSFDEWFNTPFANTGGGDKIDLNEEEALLVIRRLHKVLRPFLLRRLKKDVESELPDKVERLIRCKMSALQVKLYKRMKESGMLITDGGKGGSSKLGMKGLQNTIMQLRKICNHPFVFQPVENLINPYGTSNELLYRTAGKFELLDRILPKMFRGGHRILMFFQMTEIMTIMEDYLRFRNTKFLRLDGSTKPDERGDMLKIFNHPQSDIQIFLLSTRAGGLGLNLQTADTVIIYDSDWNPHQDLQAQDRAHRIGQKKEVRIFRFVTEKSIEEHILARAREKLEIDKKVIQGGRFDNKSSASEREEFLRAILENNEEDEDDTADLGDDELNDILARGEDERELFTQMDLERVKNEELAWIRAGNRGPVPERLITDAELPDVYHVEHSLAPAVEEILDQRRKKTNVHYDDGLTEEQWTAAIEDDNTDLADVIEKNRRDNLGIPDDDQFSTSDGKTRGNSVGDFESENGSPGPAAANKKRKRGRPSAASRGVSADLGGSVNGDIQAGGKKRKTGKQPAYEDPELKRMQEVMEACFEAVEEVDNPEEGHQCCGLFYKLPSKKDYPVYYVMILKPICMDQIKKKIDKMQYRTLDEFTEDFRLMFTNARIYNEDGSTVWKDANYMEQAFMHKFNELTQPPSGGSGGHFGDGVRVKTIIESDEDE